jgi:hypothetical protein
LEHKIERDRAKQFLQSMLVDVPINIINLDSLMKNRLMIVNHDLLVNWLLEDSAVIDRPAFARKMGTVWGKKFFWCGKNL